MLTFPVDSSTNWTCPGVRPGNASVFAVKQQSPRGLSAVSKTAQSSGGLWNLYTRTLFWRAMAMCVLDNRTPRTVVRTGSCIATFCFASSQMITWTNCERRFRQTIPPLADLVLRKFWLLASSDKRNKVGFPKHLYCAYSGVEV
jgi:hypothetical protein